MKALLLLLAFFAAAALGCTNYLVTKSASAGANSTFIGYAADSGSLFGSLGHYAAQQNIPPGTEREVYSWDASTYMGTIPEASEVYNVVGNMNEFQLTIGETTFGGLPQLGQQPGAILDYGSLIWITLQRAKTAREAIALFGNLTALYGYASSGESFSIADPNEVWVLEMIGKGPGELGAVWVAVRIPDGFVTGHANQARIRQFPLSDPDNCVYAPDVISFAVKKGLYPASARPEDFSFSDTYCPVDFGGARFCEARVWAFFNQLTPGMDQYLDYVQGRNLTNRMPLYIKPNRTISLNDTMWFMRTHFENTWFDNAGIERPDVGAGAFNSPYRWRPVEWESAGAQYVNERQVGVQQTAWHFVAQMRAGLPDAIGGKFWFSVDDTAHSVHFPLYGCATRIPAAWGDQVGQVPNGAVPYAVPASALNFNFGSAWWIFNLVANYAYARYGPVNADVTAAIVALEAQYMAESATVEAKALALLAQNPAAAVEMLTSYSEDTGAQLVAQWQGLFGSLFTKYRDGLVNTQSSTPVCTKPRQFNCTYRNIPDSLEAGYPNQWYARIVAENGAHYAVPAAKATLGARQTRKGV